MATTSPEFTLAGETYRARLTGGVRNIKLGAFLAFLVREAPDLILDWHAWRKALAEQEGREPSTVEITGYVLSKAEGLFNERILELVAHFIIDPEVAAKAAEAGRFDEEYGKVLSAVCFRAEPDELEAAVSAVIGVVREYVQSAEKGPGKALREAVQQARAGDPAPKTSSSPS